MNSSASKHLALFPHARASTLAMLIERDRVRAELEIEAAYRRRRKLINRAKAFIYWPKYVWRG